MVAVVVWLWPRATEISFYDRELIARGQWWRLWSGHLAHHGGSHLLWNLVVFFPAGIWLECVRPHSARIFLVVAPLFISAGLWFFAPDLQSYAGLSGVGVGAVTLLALVQLQRRSGEPRWVWGWLLVLIVAKMVVEFTRSETPLFAGLPAGVRNVPLAHLAGAICAGIVALLVRPKTAR